MTRRGFTLTVAAVFALAVPMAGRQRATFSSRALVVRVDVLATAVVAAAKKLNVTLPIVLRLEGTNVEEGRKILEESGLKFSVGTTMKEAADIVVAAAKGGK